MAKNSKNENQIFFFKIIAMNKNKKIYNFAFKFINPPCLKKKETFGTLKTAMKYRAFY